MIADERHYQNMLEQIGRFEAALRARQEPAADDDPALDQAVRDGVESLLRDLRDQAAEYEGLRDGRLRAVQLQGLRWVPDALIQARTDAHLTQRELAERLGLEEQQIRRYEVTRYRGVSLERLAAVADALGIMVYARVLLPTDPIVVHEPRGTKRSLKRQAV